MSDEITIEGETPKQYRFSCDGRQGGSYDTVLEMWEASKRWRIRRAIIPFSVICNSI